CVSLCREEATRAQAGIDHCALNKRIQLTASKSQHSYNDTGIASQRRVSPAM
ncbi:hypothetical protein P692DRAFT_201794391, partial [Suillus brevipes Sb2]